MYNIALIQNESEMMHYSWADIRPYISEKEYSVELFTSENIDSLFLMLQTDKLDAVIIAANACNNKHILDTLRINKDILSNFLNKGKGLLVSFQMRLADDAQYGFLPDDYEIKAINRLKKHNELPMEGDLIIPEVCNNHTILRYPTPLEAKDIKKHCLGNNTVQGLYWTYLKPEKEEYYQPLIIDGSYGEMRNVLLVSNMITNARIVISSISLDWQMHRNLWNNTLRYVVKGRPQSVLITKKGQSSFEARYLLTLLETGKIPHDKYILDRISDFSLSSVHDTIILDHCWNGDELKVFFENYSAIIMSEKLNVINLSKEEHLLPEISVISNIRSQSSRKQEILLWMQSIFNLNGSPYWQNSFWSSFEVISTLRYFNYPIEQYSIDLTREIMLHDINGSYDNVMGASCAQLFLFFLFLGKEDIRTNKTITWIKNNIDNKNLYEKSTALDTFVQLGIEIEDSIKDKIIAEIHEKAMETSINEFRIIRFCRTLLSCNEIESAYNIILKLQDKQDSNDGKWVNISNTASTVDLLIDLYRKINKRSTKELEIMIYSGIQYIKSYFASCEDNWMKDVAVSAKCLRTLDKFEKMVSIPIDTVLHIITDSEEMNQYATALRLASESNLKLIDDNSILSGTIVKKNETIDKMKKNTKFNDIVIIVLITLLVVVFIMIGISLNQLKEQGYSTQIRTFISNLAVDYIVCLLIALPSVGITCLIYFLIRKKKAPNWVKFMLKTILKVDIDEKEDK